MWYKRGMKTVCDFCKTEYSLDAAPTGPVKCAVCGHTWTVPRQARRSPILVFIAALCALLAAAVFAFAVMYQHRVTEIQNHPLVAQLDDISIESDEENGTSQFVVDGRVVNRSSQIYGVPGLVVISYDAAGNIVARQRFLPPATLLDAGASANFRHTLSVPIDNVDKISVELETQGD